MCGTCFRSANVKGDLNSEIKEPSMKDFCDTYNLKNLIKDPTCFKHPLNPSSIDVINGEGFRIAKSLKQAFLTITR